jgi:hypothetical protein
VGDSHLLCGSQYEHKPSCSQANKPHWPWKMTVIPWASRYESFSSTFVLATH